jgi:hypothetical protein
MYLMLGYGLGNLFYLIFFPEWNDIYNTYIYST